MMKLLFSAILAISFADDRTPAGTEQVQETFRYNYDRDGNPPTLIFRDLSGRDIGVYVGTLGTDLYQATVVKKQNTEFLVTSWTNGAGTYNIRVFVPVAKDGFFKNRAFHREPLCDLGLRGDPPDFTVQDERIILDQGTRTVRGHTVRTQLIQVQVRDQGSKYQDCRLFPID